MYILDEPLHSKKKNELFEFSFFLILTKKSDFSLIFTLFGERRRIIIRRRSASDQPHSVHRRLIKPARDSLQHGRGGRKFLQLLTKKDGCLEGLISRKTW